MNSFENATTRDVATYASAGIVKAGGNGGVSGEGVNEGDGGGGGGGGITPEEWKVVADRLHLSPRQVEIIQAIMAGDGKPATIAHRLGIGASSVKTHIERLYVNLDVHDRVEVVVKVFTE